MKRRVSLGLAEPIVANRFALWTIASVTGIVFLFTSVPPMFAIGEVWIAIDLVVFAVAGLATAGAYWLAFFPPESFRRYIRPDPA